MKINQILQTDSPEYEDYTFIEKSKFNKVWFFKLQLIASAFVASFLLVFYSYNLYITKKNEDLSDILLANYNISLLYSNNTNNYSTSLDSASLHMDTDNSYFVIGVIKIDKIKITYPILSETSEDLLKISICRFLGPNANEVGNLCIAGHNYRDYRFFSKLGDLSNGDIITIYDLSGNPVNYSVYDKSEVDATDFSATSQETNGKREVTLISCNNVKGKRIIVKAVEVNNTETIQTS